MMKIKSLWKLVYLCPITWLVIMLLCLVTMIKVFIFEKRTESPIFYDDRTLKPQLIKVSPETWTHPNPNKRYFFDEKDKAEYERVERIKRELERKKGDNDE